MELKRVVVTGLGALTPIGLGVESYWRALLQGASGAGPITHFDPEKFKTRFACELKGFDVDNYMPRKEAQRMDPCAQYAMVSTMEALADSGLDVERLDKDRVGVIIDGRMICCGTLDEVCDGLSLEDRFFEIYKEQKGGEE